MPCRGTGGVDHQHRADAAATCIRRSASPTGASGGSAAGVRRGRLPSEASSEPSASVLREVKLACTRAPRGSSSNCQARRVRKSAKTGLRFGHGAHGGHRQQFSAEDVALRGVGGGDRPPGQRRADREQLAGLVLERRRARRRRPVTAAAAHQQQGCAPARWPVPAAPRPGRGRSRGPPQQQPIQVARRHLREGRHRRQLGAQVAQQAADDGRGGVGHPQAYGRLTMAGLAWIKPHAPPPGHKKAPLDGTRPWSGEAEAAQGLPRFRSG